MAEHHTEYGTLVNRTRYAPLRTIYGMAKKPPDVKDLFWENTRAEMSRAYGEENLQRLGREAKIGGAGATRIKNGKNVGLDMVQRVAVSFNRQPWQMLLPNMEPIDQPVINIPRLSNSAALGKGRELLESDQVIEHIALTKNWVGMHIPRSSKPENLRVIAALGDSMDPTLKDGDLVLVDTATRSADVDGIFVLRDPPEGLLIKRVSRTARGLVVTSDNPAAPPFGMLAEATIVGKVVWAWNGRKL